MNRKRLPIFLFYGLLAVLFIFWEIKGFFQPRKKQTFANTRISKPLQKKQITPALGAMGGGRLKSSYSSWGRNPFIPGSPKDAPELILKGIIWDEKIPLAVINDKILRKGDEIGDKKVLEIQRDKVIIYDVRGNFELNLE